MSDLTADELSTMELAFLFKIPLYKLLEEMPYEEYVGWLQFFKERPPGAAEDYRAAMIMSAFSKDVPINKIFPSLADRQKASAAVGSAVKSSAFFSKMATAIGDTTPPGFYDN